MTFKPLNENDIVNTRTLLHEAIPLTGTIISGTYSDENVKQYSHGMFESVYDYPYLSSSANHIFDVTVGISPSSNYYNLITTTNGMQSKKKNIYNQMAQVLMGYDATGSIQQFDQDGNIIGGGMKIDSAFIIPFSRLLVKDEIKKQTFSMQLGVNSDYRNPFSNIITISDVSASTEYRVNSPVGEYGILYATSSTSSSLEAGLGDLTSSINGTRYWYAGLIYYQAGVVVLTGSILGSMLNHGLIGGEPLELIEKYATAAANAGWNSQEVAFTGSTISASAQGLRHRIKNIQFNNTTELNSTIYFCRANHNEFNYSSNPTYLTGSKIRVKSQATDNPVSYITTVGLYNDNNELMATAKLSEPLKKSPATEFTIRTRLDY
tara:strand:+ start:11439 stop:12572 length:1134 start_codon:yes stop_codon:yes gene_type:complete